VRKKTTYVEVYNPPIIIIYVDKALSLVFGESQSGFTLQLLDLLSLKTSLLAHSLVLANNLGIFYHYEGRV
jgi:hypothetical protein